MIIFIRGLNLLILGGFVAVGIAHPLKQIFKKRDVGLAITLALVIFVFIYSGVSWFIPVN
jgi:hypothetical protein